MKKLFWKLCLKASNILLFVVLLMNYFCDKIKQKCHKMRRYLINKQYYYMFQLNSTIKICVENEQCLNDSVKVYYKYGHGKQILNDVLASNNCRGYTYEHMSDEQKKILRETPRTTVPIVLADIDQKQIPEILKQKEQKEKTDAENNS